MSQELAESPRFSQLWRYCRLPLLVLAIVHQCSHHYFLGYDVESIGSDKARQIGAAHSLLDGRGVSLRWADPDDLSSTVAKPLVGWPPGYSLLLAPILWATDDVLFAAFSLDCLSVLVFFVSWFAILEISGSFVPVAGRLLLWAFWAVGYSPLLVVTSSGKLCLALFSLAFAVMLHSLKRNRWFTMTGLVSGLAMAGTAAMRFAYWPLLAVPPVALLCIAKSKRQSLRMLVSYGVVTAIAFGALCMYRRHTTGHVTFLSVHYSDASSAIHWENLTRAIPFPLYGFGLHRTVPNVIQALRLSSGWTTTASFVLAALLLVLFVRFTWSGFHARGHHQLDRAVLQRFYSAFAAAATAITLAMLYYLSLRYPAVMIRGSQWTHVEEVRFYGPIYPFIMVAVISLFAGCAFRLHRKSKTKPEGDRPISALQSSARIGTVPALVLYCFFGLMLVSVTSYWRLANWRHSLAKLHAERPLSAFYSVVRDHVQRDDALVVLSQDRHELRLASAAGARVCRWPDAGLRQLRSSQSVPVLVSQSSIEEIVPLASDGRPEVVLELPTGSIFFLHVPPTPSATAEGSGPTAKQLSQ